MGAELGRQRPALTEAWEPVLRLITLHATIVDAPPLAEPVSDDPDDDTFLAGHSLTAQRSDCQREA